MKVTLFLDKDQGDTLEVKNKICSVLKPDHIIFDHWDGELPNNSYVIRSKDRHIYTTKVTSPEAAIVDYVGYCNGMADEKIYYNLCSILIKAIHCKKNHTKFVRVIFHFPLPPQ